MIDHRCHSLQFKYMNFHILFVFFTLYGYITSSRVARSQLVEHCKGISEVMGSNPVQACFSFFQVSISQLLKFKYKDFHTFTGMCFLILLPRTHCVEKLRDNEPIVAKTSLRFRLIPVRNTNPAVSFTPVLYEIAHNEPTLL